MGEILIASNDFNVYCSVSLKSRWSYCFSYDRLGSWGSRTFYNLNYGRPIDFESEAVVSLILVD